MNTSELFNQKYGVKNGDITDPSAFIPVIYESIQKSAKNARNNGFKYLGSTPELDQFVESVKNG